MNKLLIGLTMVLLAGCTGTDYVSSDEGDILEDHTHRYKSICIDGVVYYRHMYRLAVAFSKDSTVKTCGE